METFCHDTNIVADQSSHGNQEVQSKVGKKKCVFEETVELPWKSGLVGSHDSRKKIKQLILTQHPVLIFPVHLLIDKHQEQGE